MITTKQSMAVSTNGMTGFYMEDAMNPWMSCIIFVEVKDKYMAAECFKKAVNAALEDEEGYICYGDAFDTNLREAGIKSVVFYAPSDVDSDAYEHEKWESFCKAVMEWED